MSIQNSKETVKEFATALLEVVSALDAVSRSDADIDEMLKRKASMENALAELQNRLREESEKAEVTIAKVKADADRELAAIKEQTRIANDELNTTRTAARVSRETMQQQISDEKMQLVQAKQDHLKRLDAQIAQRQKGLDEINKAIEEGKRRFA